MEGQYYSVVKYCMLLSLLLAFALLYLSFGIVPSWLYASLVVGTVIYALVLVGVIKRVRASLYLAGFMAALILAVSLPAPAHFRFVEEGLIPQATVFILGSILQAIIIATLAVWGFKSILRRR